MDNQTELFQYVVSVFEQLNIPYFITGSFASIYYGEYRTTVDIDIVVDLKSEHIQPFITAFSSPDFYVSDDAVRDAVATRFQFNIIHGPSGLKLDIIVLGDGEFDLRRQSRIQRIEAAEGLEAWFASAEDVIIKKLLYYQEGGSDKHLRDIGGILRTSGALIDRSYIDEWARKFSVAEIWKTVWTRAAEA